MISVRPKRNVPKVNYVTTGSGNRDDDYEDSENSDGDDSFTFDGTGETFDDEVFDDGGETEEMGLPTKVATPTPKRAHKRGKATVISERKRTKTSNATNNRYGTGEVSAARIESQAQLREQWIAEGGETIPEGSYIQRRYGKLIVVRRNNSVSTKSMDYVRPCRAKLRAELEQLFGRKALPGYYLVRSRGKVIEVKNNNRLFDPLSKAAQYIKKGNRLLEIAKKLIAKGTLMRHEEPLGVRIDLFNADIDTSEADLDKLLDEIGPNFFDDVDEVEV